MNISKEAFEEKYNCKINITEETSNIKDAQERITELENALHEIGALAENGELEFYAVTSIISGALTE